MERRDPHSAHDHPEHDHAPGGSRRSRALAVVPDETPPALWRSIEARDGDPALASAAQREFPEGASELDPVSRREFVGLLGASLAIGGAACHRPPQKIVPYVRRPPEVTPGNALNFATAFGLEGFASGLLVESHAGRPTKIEGNPDHPDSLGATSAIEQALLLGLYDTDRAKQIAHKGQPVSLLGLWKQIATRAEELSKDGGARLRFLVEPSSSPLIGDLRARILQRFPKAKFVSFASVAADGAAEGAQLAFGRPLEARHDLSQAQVILSLDADFLAEGPEHVRLHRQFSSRRVGPQMNRLYVAEPCPTSTGSLADHRHRVRGGDVLALAQALVAELAKGPGAEVLGPLAALPKAQPDARIDGRWVAAVAKDLLANRGKGLVIAGRRQPAAVHALVAAMNAALGNVGTTVSFAPSVRHDALAGIEPLRALVEEIASGNVDTLVITAFNPAYTAPADFKLDKLLTRVPNTLYLTLYEDETAPSVSTIVPAAHPLESWGDARGHDGTISLVQPLIAPLWSGITEAEILAAFLGEADKGTHQLLKSYWQGRASTENLAGANGFDAAWEAWLAKGIIDRPAAAAAEPAPAVNGAMLAGALGPRLQAAPTGAGLEVAFTVDEKVYDGRFANNVWLQELPHPITKITWDNAVLVSQATAQTLGLKTADVVRVELGAAVVSGPLFVQPGHADDAVTIALGYGRAAGGKFAKGVGFNAGVLRTSAAPWFARGATLGRKAGNYRFGITQDHGVMEGRDPAIATTLSELSKPDSKVNQKLEYNRHPLVTLHKPVDYSKQPYKWAMAIDLSKCSGCGACTIACQAENNIPVVGRDNVRIGRVMHWLRIDRYYEGNVDEPEIITQPMMCVHCETAPCEYVCPVNATVHSDEGLNEMVYNRCIGTRYCSNNCPYKVRRFNFLDYHGDVPHVRKMAANPDVTVRSRGVMEKCTYCVQRIERVRIDTRIEGRAIRDGEVQTACQQACPAGAITFGSLNDPNAQVTRLHQDARRYNVLHDLNTRPRTAYLARVRNPNPELV